MSVNDPFASEVDGTPMDYYGQGGALVIDEQNVDIFRGGFMGSGEFYVRPFEIEAGQSGPDHLHKINHLWVLFEGEADIEWRSKDGSKFGTVSVRTAWAVFHVRANYHHRVVARTKVKMACFFAKAAADRLYGEGAMHDWMLADEHG